MRARHLAGALALVIASLAPRPARAEDAPDTIRIATLAPPESPWGRVLKTWQAAVRERTHATAHPLDLVFFWNGQQGDDTSCVAKMRTGQLDGAALTAIGLQQIFRPVLVLQLPGLFRTWDAIDRARDAFKDDLARGFADAGFYLGAIGDVGLARSMTRGYEVHRPEDLRGHRPYVWRDDPIGPVVLQTIGGITIVPLGVPEVLPALNTRTIDTLNVPAIVAEQLQWAARLDHISRTPSGAGIGSLVFARRKLDALAADQRAILEDTGKVASSALAGRVRALDEAAFERLAAKMTVYEPTEADRAAWADVFRRSIERIAQGTLPRAWVERAVAVSKAAGQIP